MSDNDFFRKHNLTVQTGDVEIGHVYPLYGMVTKIIDETFENFTIQLNWDTTLRCTLKDPGSVETIKSRAFEPGIFVSEITSVKPLSGNCTTIVFGRKQMKDET